MGPSYHARIGSPVSQWYIFNDFTINPIPPEEAVWFNLKWKIPCIICFTADKLPANLDKLTYKVSFPPFFLMVPYLTSYDMVSFIISINGGCSLYVPVRCCVARAIWALITFGLLLF